MMRRYLYRGLALLAASALPAASAHAEHTFLVHLAAEVRADCTFAANDSGLSIPDAVLSFGTAASDDAGPVDGTASAVGGSPAYFVACSSPLTQERSPMLTIDSGSHGQDGQRYMLGPNDARIPYQLYQDQARSIPYDPTTPVQILLPRAGQAIPIAIFGRVPNASGQPRGHYTDTVTLTLTF